MASIVRPNMEANNFELKPALLQLIQKDQFAGGSTEDPYSHLENFLLYCDTLKMIRVSRDAILLRLFSCSLKEEARGWLQSLPQGSITNWDDLATKFLSRFFSASKTARLKAEITAFEQKESESLYEAWERFKGLLRKCPQHGMEAWEKGPIFFQGMTPSTRTLVNAAAGGSLKTKTPEEALELLESLASQEFDNAPVPSRRAGIMKLDGYDAILAQNEQILQINKKQQAQLDALTKKFAKSQVSSVNNSRITYGICASTHATEECDLMRAPGTAEVNGLWYDQKNHNDPRRNQYGNDYNQGEDTSAFMQETRAAHRNQEASIRNLEIQIGLLSKQFSERAQGTFPSNTVVNPMEHCNAITTRSGTMIQRIEEQRLKKDIQKQPYSKFLDIFRRLQINIPFAEALENMPNYASSRRIYYQGSKLGITEVKPTKTIMQLADRSSKQAYGIIEDILVKVDKFIIPVDFVILDIEEDATIPMILSSKLML
ncbi:uncharacterized protein LOC133314014 [Gastrolobium bilobum]|uniref:uncharacterized protein LOC133314014 n=1 Tax=Gastrolobium bilobum TaxID=150636 RepID=UPI002AB24C64|nr:uncharacterized protein LOC133314014 [Gastrolobium bilobum]